MNTSLSYPKGCSVLDYPKDVPSKVGSCIPLLNYDGAKALLSEKVEEWRRKQYLFAAALLKNFIDNGPRPFKAGDEHKEEIRTHASPKVIAIINQKIIAEIQLNKNPPSHIRIEPEKEGVSNIRWDFIGDDNHMLWAYGGARLTVKGKVAVVASPPGWTWNGIFEIRLSDTYTFKTAAALRSLFFKAYEAGVFLQKCNHSPFRHEVVFKELPLSGTIMFSGSQLRERVGP